MRPFRPFICFPVPPVHPSWAHIATIGVPDKKGEKGRQIKEKKENNQEKWRKQLAHHQPPPPYDRAQLPANQPSWSLSLDRWLGSLKPWSEEVGGRDSKTFCSSSPCWKLPPIVVFHPVVKGGGCRLKTINCQFVTIPRTNLKYSITIHKEILWQTCWVLNLHHFTV